MSTQRRWFDRIFELGLGADTAPELLERLRKTPERLTEAVRGLPPALLTRRPEGKWSIQENAGHLLDLEPLWDQRLDDYDSGAVELHPADLENRKTTRRRITIGRSRTYSRISPPYAAPSSKGWRA